MKLLFKTHFREGVTNTVTYENLIRFIFIIFHSISRKKYIIILYFNCYFIYLGYDEYKASFGIVSHFYT